MAEFATTGRPAPEAGQAAGAGPQAARHIVVGGRVQGVGFRPFVYRLARKLGVDGHVENCVGNVEIVASAAPHILTRFCEALVEKAPPLAMPHIERVSPIDISPAGGFEIRDSRADADASIFVPPDNFLCDDCLQELEDPDDRRFGYPFTNCTQCGPRYTLIEAMPYDRPNTSMRAFPMCADCEREYRSVEDRRFHAEPIACPACGPTLDFDSATEPGDGGNAIDAAAAALLDGRIVAVKGIGGYHLMCDATSEAAVRRLRDRKQRPDKPLAVMFPCAGEDGLDALRRFASIDALEAKTIRGPARPIVLVRQGGDRALPESIAPGLDRLGVFLPYSPLHHLLLARTGRPLVATSGNISGEPVLTDNAEAERRLAPVADAFLHHDRPIVRPADDPVVRVIGGCARPLRHGRGTAPCEIRLPQKLEQPVLAVGAHMKGTVALGWQDRAVVSPHIGEMDSPRSLAVFEKLVVDLQSLYGVTAARIVCDAHPGYTTHRWASRQALPTDTVWHHEAHASALAGEFGGDLERLVFTWDGVGLGPDGSLWGGEALLGRPGHWRRVASLRRFRLPGGDKAGREPWRSAAGLSWECGEHFGGTPDVEGLAKVAWQRGLNSPTTTAVGRLFDAAAALVLKLRYASFEAQGPMQLECLCRNSRTPLHCPLDRDADGTWRSDWSPLLDMLADETFSESWRAEVFHSSMAQLLLDQAEAARRDCGVARIGLAGGVFQNRVLCEQAIALLEAAGFDVDLPERLPVNDAAISFGQLVEVAARQADET